MIKYLTIKGEQYPYKNTLNVVRKFEGKFNKRHDQIGDSMSMDEMIHLVFWGVESGCRLEGKEFDMTIDDFADHLEVNQITSLMGEAGEGEKENPKTPNL